MSGRSFVLASAVWLLLIGGALAVFRPATDENEDANPGYWIAKLHAPEQTYDSVILGDSRAYRGIDPSQLPGKALNFGFSGAALSPRYIHEGVEKIKRRGTIVVVVTPHSLSSRALESNAFSELSTRHQTDLALSRSFAPLYPITRPYTVPQMAALARRRVSVFAPASPSETYHEGGWVASSRPAVTSAPAIAKLYREMLKDHPVGPREIEELMYQLTWYSASRYRVVFLRLPVSPDVLEAESFDDTVLRERIKTLGMEWFECPPGETYDGSHLTADSARKISEALGRYLAVSPPRPARREGAGG